jgi:uncharacterized protein
MRRFDSEGEPRRNFLKKSFAFLGALAAPSAYAQSSSAINSSKLKGIDRIVDIHVHFDEHNPAYFDDVVKVAEPLNLAACVLTPYRDREATLRAAEKHPQHVIPIGFVDLDDPDAPKQVEDFHRLGYRGLGELEWVKKPFTDPTYMPIYELANGYEWVVFFHTGVVTNRMFDQPVAPGQPENVAAYRMRAFHLEEIGRRFPKITAIGAHCGNPEYDWAAETARWNPNVFFDLAGTTLVKMRGRLEQFRDYFWWSDTDPWEGTAQPEDNTSAFAKLVFGSDAGFGWHSHRSLYSVIPEQIRRYQQLFAACDVPPSAQRLIMGETLAKIFRLA